MGRSAIRSTGRSGRASIAAVVLFLVVALLTAVACSGGGKKDDVSAGSGTDSSSTTTASDGGKSGDSDISDEMPSPDIKLVDDVVVVNSKGGSMFKGYSNDGTSLLVDKSAPGLDKLKAGDILLLSGITVVRATQVDQSDDGVIVTGAPATLPEVIADGDLTWKDVVYDPDKVRLFVYEDSTTGSSSGGGGSSSSGGQSSPDSSIVDDAGQGIVDGLGMAPAGGAPSAIPVAMTAANTTTVSGKIANFSFDLTHESEGSGHHLVLDATSSGDLAGTIKVDVHLGALSTSGAAKVEGKQVRNFDFDIAQLGGDATITTELNSTKQTTSVMTPAFLKIPFGIEFPALGRWHPLHAVAQRHVPGAAVDGAGRCVTGWRGQDQLWW